MKNKKVYQKNLVQVLKDILVICVKPHTFDPFSSCACEKGVDSTKALLLLTINAPN